MKPLDAQLCGVARFGVASGEIDPRALRDTDGTELCAGDLTWSLPSALGGPGQVQMVLP
jgi:hypothetical protein